jgi:methylmalonyl-CoA mutase C-terminal domain/subunit
VYRKIRVLVGKPGLDGHDRGAKVVAAALRDAGMEVIYTGLHQTPEQVVEAAVQEDVDVVALSILSGAHMTLFPDVLELMKQRGIGDRLLSGGGIIPAEDMDALHELGVGRLFGPGASTQDIVHYIRDWFASKHGADSLPPLPPAKRMAPAYAEASAAAAKRTAHVRPAGATPSAGATRKTATRKTATTKRMTKKSATKKRATKKPTAKKRVTRKPATKRATKKRGPGKRSGASARRRGGAPSRRAR